MGRRKLVEDDEFLAVAREVFVEKGIAASTREIAHRAGISEAVIYQRHPTKAHLFFAAMVPPALNVEDLLSIPADDLSVAQQLEGIALGMMRYFREVIPILMRLVTRMGGRVFICQFRGLLHVEYRVRNLQRHACISYSAV